LGIRLRTAGFEAFGFAALSGSRRAAKLASAVRTHRKLERRRLVTLENVERRRQVPLKPLDAPLRRCRSC